MKIKAAIFDLDGTLLDSMGMWQNVCDEYLAQNGLGTQGKLSEEFRTMSLDRSSHYIKEVFNLEKSAQQIFDEIIDMVEDRYTSTLPLKDGAYDFVKRLYESGTKICVATASMRHLVIRAMKRTGLSEFASGVFTCSEAGAPKTEPAVFLQAMEFLGSKPEETWVFEDSLLAIKTAKSIGCKVAAVYDDSNADTTEQITALSDVYIKSFNETEGV